MTWAVTSFISPGAAGFLLAHTVAKLSSVVLNSRLCPFVCGSQSVYFCCCWWWWWKFISLSYNIGSHGCGEGGARQSLGTLGRIPVGQSWSQIQFCLGNLGLKTLGMTKESPFHAVKLRLKTLGWPGRAHSLHAVKCCLLYLEPLTLKLFIPNR